MAGIDFLYNIPSGATKKNVQSEKETTEKLLKAAKLMRQADAILVGGGSGLSAACGYEYYHHNPFFEEHFGGYEKKYGIKTLFEAVHFVYPTPEERWGFLAHYVQTMVSESAGQAYCNLKDLLSEKDYFILTTNIDTQFSKRFPEERIWTFQGDVRYFQCSQPCHERTYETGPVIENMIKQSVDGKVPYDLIPRCPYCGRQMDLWVRDDTFLEGDLWNEQRTRYETFLMENKHKHLVLLELGVGDMTPSIIKFPFWEMTQHWDHVDLIIVNLGQTSVPEHIRERTTLISMDAAEALSRLRQL